MFILLVLVSGLGLIRTKMEDMLEKEGNRTGKGESKSYKGFKCLIASIGLLIDTKGEREEMEDFCILFIFRKKENKEKKKGSESRPYREFKCLGS